MPHTVLDEIARARLPIRPGVLARWQHEIREYVIPELQAAEDQKAKRPTKKAETP